jgi:hypothetical protein
MLAIGESVLVIMFADDDKGKQEGVLQGIGIRAEHERKEMTVGSGGWEEGVRMVEENLPREEGSFFKELKKGGRVLHRYLFEIFA